MLKNLGIIKKLTIGFMVLAILAGVLGFNGLVNIKKLANQDRQMYEHYTVPLGIIGEMTTNIITIRVNVNKLLVLNENDQREKILEIKNVKNELLNDIQIVEPLFIAENEKDLFSKYKEKTQTYFNYIDQVILNIQSGNQQDALALVNGKAAGAASELQDVVNEILVLKVEGAKSKLDINSTTAQKSTIHTIALFILSIAIAIFLAFYINIRIRKPIQMLKDAANQLAIGKTDIDMNYDSKDEIGQVIKAFKVVITNINTLIIEAHSLKEATIEGSLDYRAEESQFDGDFKELIQDINVIMDIFIQHIDNIPMPIMMLDTNLKIKYINAAGASIADKKRNELQGLRCADIFKAGDCNSERCACARAIKENNDITSETDAHPNGLNLDIAYTGVPMRDLDGNVVGAMEVIQDLSVVKKAQREAEGQAQIIHNQMLIAEKQSKYQKQEVMKLIASLNELAKGNLDIDTEVAEADEDTQEIAENFKKIYVTLRASTQEIKSYIDELSHVLSEMAEKNLTTGIQREYLGDFIKIKDSINYILEQFNFIFSEINTAAEQVEVGSEQVASTSQSLAQGASEQASSVEEISATVSEVAEKTKQNAVNANKANELSIRVKEDAQIGNEKMISMLTAMNEVKEASTNIESVIKVIEDIAFQTNILALNAAVEAARAGEHGKGFAVVAEEVRNLAARSGKAAKETTLLIDSSIHKVEEGYQIANDTAEALKKIVEEITNAVETVGWIAEASNEQAIAISEIDRGVEQISVVTQTNTATAEESASASEEMAGQAQMLKALIQEFKRTESKDKPKLVSSGTVSTTDKSQP